MQTFMQSDCFWLAIYAFIDKYMELDFLLAYSNLKIKMTLSNLNGLNFKASLLKQKGYYFLVHALSLHSLSSMSNENLWGAERPKKP